ncbi:MAG: DUF3830 family protein [Chloroflexi bacterium]|nr:DUF3830 family protein [Chloroflexota bacterium]
MPTRIKFTFERGGELVADILHGETPQTITQVLAVLPYEATVYHTRWCGREINFPIKTLNPIPREKQTATANTGDVVYWKEWETEQNSPEALAIYYGAEVIRDHRGFLPVNVFARISPDQWQLISDIGIRVWQHGIEKVKVDMIGN